MHHKNTHVMEQSTATAVQNSTQLAKAPDVSFISHKLTSENIHDSIHGASSNTQHWAQMVNRVSLESPKLLTS